MSTIPIREVTAQLVERIYGGYLGTAISVTITQDESWSPRIQGELTAPLDLLDRLYRPGGNVALGRLQLDTLTLELITRYGRARTCADYTVAMRDGAAALLAFIKSPTIPWHPGEAIQPLSKATELWGGSVAAVTADCGGSIAAITKALRQPGGTHDIPPTEKRRILVHRRKEDPNYIENTVTIQFASEDVKLHDHRNTATAAYVSSYTSLRGLVADVLSKAYYYTGEYATLLHGGDILIPSGQEWKPAQTAWEFLHPILESVGWQLYANDKGYYVLSARAPVSSPRGLDASRDLIDFAPKQDRAARFYDGAMVEYSDGDPDIPADRWDIYVPLGARRIAHETRPGTRRATGAAENLVARSQAQATPGEALATVQISMEPGQRIQIGTPRGNRYATISATTHTYPAAETRFELRDIPPQ